MIIQAVIGNANHPNYGVATIHFPIPMKEYDHVLELLESMEIGKALERDCYVKQIVCEDYPVLKRIENSSVNLDELDYLAKRLDSFCSSETAQFMGTAITKEVSTIQDFINLTFCCVEATVVQDFQDLESIGRDHLMVKNGGCISAGKYTAKDFKKEALNLLLNKDGEVTPYGVVYENDMELKQLYDGRMFPEYLYDSNMAVTVENRAGKEFVIFLPMAGSRLQHEVLRAGEDSPESLTVRKIEWLLPIKMMDFRVPERETINHLNRLSNMFYGLKQKDLEIFVQNVDLNNPKNDLGGDISNEIKLEM